MSAENGKVCCNCRHNIRRDDDKGYTHCYCEIDDKYMGYSQVMEGWCKHWSKERWTSDETDKDAI